MANHAAFFHRWFDRLLILGAIGAFLYPGDDGVISSAGSMLLIGPRKADSRREPLPLPL